MSFGELRAWGDLHAKETTEIDLGVNPGLLVSTMKESTEPKPDIPVGSLCVLRAFPGCKMFGASLLGTYGSEADPVYYLGFNTEGQWCGLYYTEGNLKGCQGGELGDEGPNYVKTRGRQIERGSSNWLPHAKILVAGNNKNARKRLAALAEKKPPPEGLGHFL